MNDKPKGISGWLVFPLILLMYSIFTSVIILKYDILPVLTGDMWVSLTTPGEDHYQWFWGPAIITELVVSVIIILLALVSVILFVKKKKILTKIIIGYYVFSCVAITAEYIGFKLFIFPVSPEIYYILIDKLQTRLIGGYVWAFIWVPYFLFSQRVKNTFVN